MILLNNLSSTVAINNMETPILYPELHDQQSSSNALSSITRLDYISDTFQMIQEYCNKYGTIMVLRPSYAPSAPLDTNTLFYLKIHYNYNNDYKAVYIRRGYWG
jgi:hypothetical protein